MSADLSVWSNHKMIYNSPEEGIEVFQRLTSKKLMQLDYRTDQPLLLTKKIEEIDYYTNFELLGRQYGNRGQISIATNFEFCNVIEIYSKTMKIKPTGFRTRYGIWQELVTGKYESEDKDEMARMRTYRKYWLVFRKFIHLITKELGGDKIIYIDDQNYQLQEDELYEGHSLEQGIISLKEFREPYELELLALFPDKFKAKYTWHYEELKNETEQNIR